MCFDVYHDRMRVWWRYSLDVGCLFLFFTAVAVVACKEGEGRILVIYFNFALGGKRFDRAGSYPVAALEVDRSELCAEPREIADVVSL